MDRERLLAASRAGGGPGIGADELDADLSRVLSQPRDQAAQGVLEAAVDRGADPRMAADAFLLS
ncbi:MAG: hypothetical protein FJ104_12250, partial [Deltaproteobacteria bacterium]|nr:hypothetical protein [Deltaproteobacteria bacterium]